MGKEVSYNVGRNLSFLYAVYAFVSLFFNIEVFGTLFLIVVFPIILLYLNKLLNNEYMYHNKCIFIIAIIILIISAVAPIIGVVILSTIVDLSTFSNLSSANMPNQNIVIGFANFTYILLITRGIALLMLSVFLLNKFESFRVSLKIATLFLGVLGIHTISTSFMGLFPRSLVIFPHQVTMNIINIIKYSMPIIFVFLFASLFMEFKSGSTITDDEIQIEGIE